MKKIITFALALFAAFNTRAQCSPLIYAGGAHADISSIMELNIKTDFCATGNGVDNDHFAFEAATNFINARKGYCKLIIPAGTYIVGNPVSGNGYFLHGGTVLNIFGCTNVEIVGESNPTLRYADGFHYGYFDSLSGMPLTDAQASLISWGSTTPRPACWAFTENMISVSYNLKDGYIKISGLTLDGNAYPGKMVLGGKDNDVDIQLPNYGIRVLDVANLSLNNLTVKRFGLDGLYILNGDTVYKTNKFNINNCVFEYNGRQAMSICGADSGIINNSQFNSSGMGILASIPAAGIDIEEEIPTKIARNLIFNNCRFENNRKSAIDITSGLGIGKGFYFNNCSIVAMKNPETAVPGSNTGNLAVEMSLYKKVRFHNCDIYGVVMDGGNEASTVDDGVHFSKCRFSDCYYRKDTVSDELLRVPPYTHSTITLLTRDGKYSKYLRVDSCSFDLYNKRLWLLNTTTNEPTSVTNTQIRINSPNTYTDFVNIGYDSNVVFSNNVFYYYWYQNYQHIQNSLVYNAPYEIDGIRFWHWSVPNNLYPSACADTLDTALTMKGGQNGHLLPAEKANPIDQDIRLYPNPVHQSRFCIENTSNKQFYYELSDVRGGLLDKSMIGPYAKSNIQYPRLAPGIYLVKLSNKSATKIIKLVVQ